MNPAALSGERRTGQMVRIVFIIASLHRGGAEKQLTLLVRGLDHSRFHCTVITTYYGGELAKELNGIENVDVISVHKGGRRDRIPALFRLNQLIRGLNPHIVHGYLDSSNVLALVTARFASARAVWGVRSSHLDSSQLDTASRFYRRLGSLLSARADLIIANSSAGRNFVMSLGYPAKRVIVVPNGFETERFAPDSAGRARARKQWGVDDHTPLVGLVARLDRIKDHTTFLRAAALLTKRMPEVKFVCIGGGGSAEYELELRQLADDLELGNHVIWAGETADMAAAHNGLDVASLVSTSEGFPNAVGESMACAVPCVVTDVGDSAEIVGKTGLVIPPGDPDALCDALLAMLTLTPDERAELGSQARRRILDHFSVTSLVDRTSTALLTLVGDPPLQSTNGSAQKASSHRYKR